MNKEQPRLLQIVDSGQVGKVSWNICASQTRKVRHRVGNCIVLSVLFGYPEREPSSRTRFRGQTQNSLMASMRENLMIACIAASCVSIKPTKKQKCSEELQGQDIVLNVSDTFDRVGCGFLLPCDFWNMV